MGLFCEFVVLIFLLLTLTSSVLSQLSNGTKNIFTPLVVQGYSTNEKTNIVHIPSNQYGVAQKAFIKGPVLASQLQYNTAKFNEGADYNLALLGGLRGSGGLRARINNRGFQYFSNILNPIISQQIKRARIPNINQCIPQVNGCLQVYNIYVSRYRCPQRVVLYPAPPNQIVVAVENFDIGVTGNLGGQINILVPIALYGIVQMNAHQVSVRVSLIIERNPVTGGVSIRVASCLTTVGYVDAYIENGGIVGDIANSQFRGKISEMVRSMLPSQICNQMPSVVNEHLNGKLNSIPQSIALSQLLQTALNSFGLNNLLNGGAGPKQCAATCHKKHSIAAAPHVSNGTVLLPLPPSSLSYLVEQDNQKLFNHPQQNLRNGAHNIGKTILYGEASNNPRVIISNTRKAQVADDAHLYGSPSKKKFFQKELNLQQNSLNHFDVGSNPNFPVNHLHHITHLQQIQHTTANVTLKSFDPSASINEFDKKRSQRQSYYGFASRNVVYPTNNLLQRDITFGVTTQFGNPRTAINKNELKSFNPSFNPPYNPPLLPGNSLQQSNPCLGCSNANENDSPLGVLSIVLQSLDFSKLSSIYLTVQLLQTYATNQDFMVELTGEFSPGGQGGTPFSAFPMQFTTLTGAKMAEILISDWTINSLFYHLHRVGFLTVRIGPETPKIGELLKTTCSSDEDDGLEDHGVETDESDSIINRKIRNAVFDNSTVAVRTRRQDDSGGTLADLGICFGDILPLVRVKYPNQKIVIQIHSSRAPSVILSGRNGGTAILDFVLNTDIYIQATNEKAGTIQVAATIEFLIKTTGGRISAHADITHLQLRDLSGTLGLTQEALDNLGNLGKVLLLKAGNDALEKGTPLNVPPNIGGLPLTFIDPEIHVVEHALHLASDFTINPSAFSQLGVISGVC